MPRRARIVCPGLPIHAVQRGNNRQPCFFEDEDRDFYLFHLQRMLGRTDCELHAYCLMTNHVHLLLTPKQEESCARLMKHIGQLYTQYINRRRDRKGTLWEGRFHSCIVQTEQYLLTCYRYVELNPVRAGIVPHPLAYPWSSYRGNAGVAENALLTPHPEFHRLGSGPVPASAAYRELVELELEPGAVQAIRKATYGNIALGDEAFKARLASTLRRRVDHGRPGRPSKAPENRGLSLI